MQQPLSVAAALDLDVLRLWTGTVLEASVPIGRSDRHAQFQRLSIPDAERSEERQVADLLPLGTCELRQAAARQLDEPGAGDDSQA
jgi:hypothetical protein